MNNAEAHWMHYYSFDELIVLVSDALGMTDLDIKYYRTSFWVHFSKDTEERFLNKDVEENYFIRRKMPHSIRPHVGRDAARDL